MCLNIGPWQNVISLEVNDHDPWASWRTNRKYSGIYENGINITFWLSILLSSDLERTKWDPIHHAVKRYGVPLFPPKNLAAPCTRKYFAKDY